MTLCQHVNFDQNSLSPRDGPPGPTRPRGGVGGRSRLMACIQVSAAMGRSLGEEEEPGESTRIHKAGRFSRTPDAPSARRRQRERTAVEDRAVIQRCLRRNRVDELGVHHEVAAKNEDGARVVGGAAVVGRGEQRDELALREALKPCVQKQATSVESTGV